MGNLSRKIFLFILLLLFGCVSSSTVSAQNETESHITKSIIANEIEYELTRYLDSHNFSKNDLNITETIEYGGSYIDSNGTFHFLIKNLTDEKSEFVTSKLDSPTLMIYHDINVLKSVNQKQISEYIHNNVIISGVDYSQKEIEHNMEKILASDLVTKGLIVEVYTDYSINGIVIAYDIKDISEETLTTFLRNYLEITGNFLFEAVSDSGELQEHISVYAGQRIVISGGSCSSGFSAKSDSGIGFVTAGHCGQVGSSVSYSNTNIGIITKLAYQSNIDAAFVRVNSSHSVIKQERTPPYNPVSYSNARTTLPVQGSTMLFSGQYTRKNVTLQSNNASFVATNMTWTNMLKYPETSVPGDSGGILLVGNQAVGVNRGGTHYNIPGLGGSYATPSSTVLNVLGLIN